VRCCRRCVQHGKHALSLADASSSAVFHTLTCTLSSNGFGYVRDARWQSATSRASPFVSPLEHSYSQPVLYVTRLHPT